ncbi:MAG: hypothetical protein M0R80_08060 [Proteobacteria bacterium]|nr:hypothetical protein [Pseudomonadota bacterium]
MSNKKIKKAAKRIAHSRNRDLEVAVGVSEDFSPTGALPTKKKLKKILDEATAQIVPIPGLETEMPIGMIPTARTVATLYVLERTGVVRMQFDDGSDDVDTAEQLQQIAGEVGYEFLWVSEPHVAYLISPDNVPEL